MLIFISILKLGLNIVFKFQSTKSYQFELKFIWIKIILKVDLLNFNKALNDKLSVTLIFIRFSLKFLLIFKFLQHNFLANQLEVIFNPYLQICFLL